MSKQQILWPGWETVRLIGRGSFGAVYEIERKLFEDDEPEKAALKVISIPQNDSDIEEMYNDGYDEESVTSTFHTHLKSIVAEYSLMRKMNGSSNVVNCDDVRYVQHDDGIGWDIYIKMELLTPLAKALPATVSEGQVIKIAKDMCAALELCSKHNIIHRDIKPQNIFVSENGDYKLGDFGIAKTVEKTMGGTKTGTYKYMAPEVYSNRPYSSTADIYSLGLVLYWLLNERRMPFMPLPPEKLKAGMDEESRSRRFSGEQIPAPKNGSEELKRIVLKACAFDPKDRYQSAREMQEAVVRLSGSYASSSTLASKLIISPDTYTNSDEQTAGPAFEMIPSDKLEERTVGPVFDHDAATDEEDLSRTIGPEFKDKPKISNPDEPTKRSDKSKLKIGALIAAACLLILLILGYLCNSSPSMIPDNGYTQEKMDDKIITIAASPKPHAEILSVAKEVLAKDGWILEITEYSDYVVPNNVVENGKIDANFFQNAFYLDAFNAEYGTHLVSVAMIHYEPFGIYAGTKTAIADLSWGDKIAIPNDGLNRARALRLLEAEGVITLNVGVGLDATVLDIAKNPLNVEIIEMEAAQIAGVRDTIALAVINGKYVLEAGLNVDSDALAIEDVEYRAATTYADVLVVKAGNEENEKIQALKEALLSEEVKNFINKNYSGTVASLREEMMPFFERILATNYHTIGFRPDGTYRILKTDSKWNDYYDMLPQYDDVIWVDDTITHLAALRKDGTAVACGDNCYGECNVSSWTDLVALETGSCTDILDTNGDGVIQNDELYDFGWTVGLKSDGTVVATGDNRVGQCNVSAWENVKQIAVGVGFTVGLKNDGTVLFTGSNFNNALDVSGWRNIEKIYVNDNNFVVGLKSDGTVVATGINNEGQCNVGAWTDIVDVSVGIMFTAGLKKDGTVVATGSNGWEKCVVSGWQDIIDIEAGAQHLVGLKSDGTVVAWGYNEAGQCMVSLYENIYQIVAGRQHTAVLTNDGTVYSS